MKDCDLLLIGHLSRDIIVDQGREERSTGGAVWFSSVAARRSGASVLVATRLAAGDRALVEPLLAEGIEVAVLDSPATTSIRNVYPSADRERREVSLLARAAPFTAEEIPAARCRVCYLAGLFRGEIPEELIPPLSGRAPLALDAQGLVRSSEGGRLAYRDWERKADYLPRVAWLKTDAAEAEVLTGEANREKAARALGRLGAGEVMVTHHEGVLLFDGERVHRAPFTPANLSGRTGRGDTCFAAYLTWRLSHGVAESLRYAAALTSLKMEAPGAFRGTVEAVLRRMEADRPPGVDP